MDRWCLAARASIPSKLAPFLRDPSPLLRSDSSSSPPAHDACSCLRVFTHLSLEAWNDPCCQDECWVPMHLLSAGTDASGLGWRRSVIMGIIVDLEETSLNMKGRRSVRNLCQLPRESRAHWGSVPSDCASGEVALASGSRADPCPAWSAPAHDILLARLVTLWEQPWLQDDHSVDGSRPSPHVLHQGNLQSRERRPCSRLQKPQLLLTEYFLGPGSNSSRYTC
ncbi:uncharacterized protein LOC104872274 isoform X2 [Fukomys damarensis]|uniref:uncharacterized protein LOC104872274 isoform X2 n=1 Tax=Fukomys damarensis TaxID=885580 RepID=UPI001455585E|nr:uncharacterized protein LOC104872274 isoform X2 [Fukomys damarensis]